MINMWPLDRHSIQNGANAATGPDALLEVTRRVVGDGVRPGRSVVFLWTVGDDHGLSGSDWCVPPSLPFTGD
jgi:hypothetical protein